MHTVSNSSSNSVSSNVEEVSSTSPMKPPPLLPPPPLQERLQRLISGASVVLDPPEPGNETESRKLPSSKYKGVVPQPNGRWGAQIYEKHQRVWLGTFNEEVEAARVYDIAAQRFRGRDAVTNFKSLSETNESDALVLFFLNSHSKAEIVDMLRKHTYYDEIHRSRMTSAGNLLKLKNGAILRYQGISGLSARDHLFDKVVTPSDVGKLNRLVVPKQHAEKYFPLNVGKSSTSNGVLLNFEDSSRKVWRFRYSYWNSSQSYVLTKGWSRFVKEKGLSAGDIVSFHRSNGPDRSLHIDWKRRSTISVGGGSGCDSYRSSNIRIQPVRPVEVVRLFGVNIVKSPEPLTVEGGNRFTSNEDWSGKRRRDQLEILRSHCFTKKQHIGMLGWERR